MSFFFVVEKKKKGKKVYIGDTCVDGEGGVWGLYRSISSEKVNGEK